MAGGCVVSDTVLVVEDELFIRMDVADHLESCGYRVIVAGSASEAIAALNGHPDIKLVFTDVRMPGTRDGLDLARWVIENRPSIPVMIASGDLGRETAMRELCGVRAFVKPYDLEDVSMAVKAALAPRHRR